MGIALTGSTATAQQQHEVWEVTVAVHVREAAGTPIALHIAVPANDPQQEIDQLAVTARGLATDIVQGDHPEVILRGPVLGGKRVAITYRATLRHEPRTPAKMFATDDPPLEVVESLAPAPLFPSRSILVREFLETKVAPKVTSKEEVLPTIYQVTRKRLTRNKDGKSLALDVIRSGEGKRIGIERCFTTFLRCARFPARFVEGLKLDSTTHRKRVFWTEAWSNGTWLPFSASGGWRGERPAAHLAVTRDGRRVVRLEGDAEIEYWVQAVPLESTLPPPRKAKR